MSVEEFYKRCQNAGWKTVIEVWSFFTLLYQDKFDAMPNKFRNLHVGTFDVRKGKITIHVEECVR